MYSESPFYSNIVKAIAGVKSTSSVVFMLLLLTGIISPGCLTLAYFSKGLMAAVYLVFAAVPPLAVLVFYTYFARRNPDYLRSEKYQLQSTAMLLLGDESKTIQEIKGEYTHSAIDQSATPLVAVQEGQDDSVNTSEEGSHTK